MNNVSYEEKRVRNLDKVYVSLSTGIALVYGSDIVDSISPLGAGIARVAGIGSILYAANKGYHMIKGDF